MYEATPSNRFATLFYGAYDSTSREFAYVNGGHNPPIVLRGEEKLLVTVRPNLPAKNANAAKEVQKLFGAPYRSVRIWPREAGGEWKWDEHPIAAVPEDGSFAAGQA